jgi:hypothetical protein
MLAGAWPNPSKDEGFTPGALAPLLTPPTDAARPCIPDPAGADICLDSVPLWTEPCDIPELPTVKLRSRDP